MPCRCLPDVFLVLFDALLVLFLVAGTFLMLFGGLLVLSLVAGAFLMFPGAFPERL